MRRGRRLKSDGALPVISQSHEEEDDDDDDEGSRTPQNPRMSVRAVEEHEETAGLLARIDEINEEKEKLTEQLKQQQVSNITDDFADEKSTTKILAAGALHGSRPSQGQSRRGLSARDRQQLLELVNRRKSAGAGAGAKWRQGEARRQILLGEVRRRGELSASSATTAGGASVLPSAGGSSESTAPPSIRRVRSENGAAPGGATQAGGGAAQAQAAAAECVTRLPRGGIHVNTVHGAVQFGIPPETIKDSITRFGSPPQFYVVPQERFNLTTGSHSTLEVPPWQRPSSAPAPPRGAPSGSGQLGTPRERPAHWAPSDCLGCSSEPPLQSPMSPPCGRPNPNPNPNP